MFKFTTIKFSRENKAHIDMQVSSMSQGQSLIEKHRFFVLSKSETTFNSLVFSRKKKQNMLKYTYLIIYRKKIITALKADTRATSVAKKSKMGG